MSEQLNTLETEQNLQAEEQQNEAVKKEAAVYDEEYILDLKNQHETEKQKAIDEALKKAKMTKDDLINYELEEKQKALNEKEAELSKRELTAETTKMMAENELPYEALEFVMGNDKETTEKRLQAFKTMFGDAVQKEVIKRIAGKTPPAGTGTSSSTGTSGFINAVIENQAKRK